MKNIFFPERLQQGFTLIELLVAMGILMTIVLMMANLFQQTTIAWETGTRQAEAGLEARAALGRIQHDLSQAVSSADRNFSASGSTLDFWTLSGWQSGEGQREARRVSYQRVGSELRRNNVALVGNVVGFDVIPSSSSSGMDLPAWVDVFLQVRAERERSRVRVYAEGQEGVADTTR